jgi:hypothetical protein
MAIACNLPDSPSKDFRPYWQGQVLDRIAQSSLLQSAVSKTYFAVDSISRVTPLRASSRLDLALE